MDQSSDIRLISAPSTYGPFDPDLIGVLGACLALGHAKDAPTLRADVARVGAERLFALTDRLRLTPALASALQDKALFSDMPPIALPGGRRTIAKTIADELAAHEERSAALTARLEIGRAHV